ncbi:spermatogenesis-associated protein 4 [Myripristis murdjan]|uniref:spermatogenesis-associated protein 4 n=1 Tax=Myripristis murdjan TaxID=586833 RepID=UPI001175E64E|nr:spermatogenesis-associated protein 4 [Myripristis murdjan]
MAYAQHPKKTGLPREVVKWLQNLDLSFYPKNVRRDFSNGYLVAEMFSRYHPEDFPMHSYDKGSSLSAKQWNWSQIERFLQRKKLHVMKEAIYGTIHCKPGAAELVVQEIYTILTKQSIKGFQGPKTDFTDQEYQEQLPMVARSTASKAIKNNLRITEIMAEPNISTNQTKAEAIIRRHLELKAAERAYNPGHFKGKSTMAQLAATSLLSSYQGDQCSGSSASVGTSSKSPPSSLQSGPIVSFKEIKVHQPFRRSLVDY